MKPRPVAQVLAKFGVAAMTSEAPASAPHFEIQPTPAHLEEIAAPDPEIDLEAAVAQARAQEAERASLHYEGVLQEQRRLASSERAEARELWAREEGGRLAAGLRSALAQLEEDIAASAAAILSQLLEVSARKRALEELVAAVRDVVAGSGPSICVRGRADILRSLQDGLGETSACIEFIEDACGEVSVRTSAAVIETRFLTWRRFLEEAAE